MKNPIMFNRMWQFRDIAVKVKGMSLHRAVSSPLDRSKRFFDRSKRFTLYHLVDLFIPTPTPLLLEAFSHPAAKSIRMSIAWYSFTQLGELRHHGENENAQTS